MTQPRDVNVHEYWRSLVAGDSTADVDEVGHPDMGREWNRWAYRLRLEALDTALRLAFPTRGKAPLRVFEAAYGVGFYLAYWQRLGFTNVAGVDISERTSVNCRRRFPMFDLRAGAIEGLDAQPDWGTLRHSFEVVTAIDVLYHVVDDELAERALTRLAELVAPGGVLIVTEKMSGLKATWRESAIVTRRPRSWYDTVLSRHGLTLEAERPVFWAMDPSTFHGPQRVAATGSRLLWWSMRAALKPLVRNGVPQRALGRFLGAVGYAADRLALTLLPSAPNTSILVYRTGVASR